MSNLKKIKNIIYGTLETNTSTITADTYGYAVCFPLGRTWRSYMTYSIRIIGTRGIDMRLNLGLTQIIKLSIAKVIIYDGSLSSAKRLSITESILKELE